MIENEVLKEDKKYVALMIGGSLLISLFTIIFGTLLARNTNPIMAGTGNAVEVLGWLWVAGTIGISFMIQAQMRHVHETTKAVRVSEAAAV